VKGAFTGAIALKEGLFKYANGRTLLLDAIGNTTLGFLAKLLRALQEGEISPVESNRSKNVDVRAIASTNPVSRGFGNHGEGVGTKALGIAIGVMSMHCCQLTPPRAKATTVRYTVFHGFNCE